jgi:hypothetical protein
MITPLLASLGPVAAWLLLLVLGIAFGAVLESAGFGNSRLLAAQFYFRNLTVLKVMFSAIVTAMTLLYLASGLGLLSLDAMWINPTYLGPDVLGGLLMGVGFVIGGYCPGTSLVSMVTLKLDGLWFVLGVLLGISLFGETVGLYTPFFIGGEQHNLTLQSLFGVPVGYVVVTVSLMAMGMFKGGELLEARFGTGREARLPHLAIAGYLGAALLVLLVGQPSVEARWERLAAVQGARLERREPFVPPVEIAKLLHDERIELYVWDYRPEARYHLVRLTEAVPRLPGQLDELSIAQWKGRPANAVFLLMDDDESRAVAEWKRLVALGLHNVYIADGGMRAWVEAFHEHAALRPEPSAPYGYELAPRGAEQPIVKTSREWSEGLVTAPKVRLQLKAGPRKGGCG